MPIRTFFTSDTHFGHAGVLAMSGRPFASIEEHDNMLVVAWNSVVASRDEVWHLGDFAHGASPERCAQLFRRLRGRKCLIRGNHDKQRTTSLPWHEQHLMLTRKIEGRRITLCHYPMRGWPGTFRGALHLHGHTHGLLPGTSQSCDVGVDRWGYRPVALDEIMERMAETPDAPEERRLARALEAENEAGDE